jgi:hypothetical protein
MAISPRRASRSMAGSTSVRSTSRRTLASWASVARQVHVALAAGLFQPMAHAGLDAHVGFLADAQRRRQPVRRQEADAPHIKGQAVGILAHALNGRSAVAFVDARRQGRGHAVALQEDHDLALAALGGPGLLDGQGPRVSDAGHLANALWFCVEDLQGPFPETGHDAGRELGADALDKTRPQVALDALQGLRRKLGVRNDAELPAEARVVLEIAGRAQARAHGQAQQGSHRGHGFGLAFDLQPHHREFAVGSGKDDAFEGALEGLVRGIAGTLAGRALEKVHTPPQPPVRRRLRQGEGSGLVADAVLGQDLEEVEEREHAEAANFQQAAEGPAVGRAARFVAAQGIVGARLDFVTILPNQNVGRGHRARKKFPRQSFAARGMNPESSQGFESAR